MLNSIIMAPDSIFADSIPAALGACVSRLRVANLLDISTFKTKLSHTGTDMFHQEVIAAIILSYFCFRPFSLH